MNIPLIWPFAKTSETIWDPICISLDLFPDQLLRNGSGIDFMMKPIYGH